MKKTIRCIICCIFIVNISTVEAQKDTTFSMVPSFDTANAREKLTKTGWFKKRQNEHIKHIDFDGGVLNITCGKSKLDDVIKEINKKVRLMWSGPMEKAKVQLYDASQITNEEPETPTKSENKYNPDVDAFLNIEDSTIFLDDIFLELEIEEIHPRSLSYYSLIKDIYQFRKKLEELLKVPYGYDKAAKKLLSEIDELYGEIVNHKDVKYLTREQKDYFNESLLVIYNRYNDIER